MRSETWRPVVGYEDLYEVSDQGRVKRIAPGQGARVGRILKTTPSKHLGYSMVGLYRKNTQKTHYVHCLVLEAFVGPRPPGHEACHWNGIRDDNRLENLRWGTSSDNNYDIVRLGRSKQASQTHCKRGHLLQEPNIYLRNGTQRACKACSWAASYATRTGTEFDEARSDREYKRIMDARLAEREMKEAGDE